MFYFVLFVDNEKKGKSLVKIRKVVRSKCHVEPKKKRVQMSRKKVLIEHRLACGGWLILQLAGCYQFSKTWLIQ